jgi:FtsZ-binding cell division protein ZapB|tara:strand:- start:3368 stop:3595 length:228 start_codon:yes stop_codon:yes gene_type:complete
MVFVGMDDATRQLFTTRFEELMTKIQSLEKDSSEREEATKQLQDELAQAKSTAAAFQEKTESSDTMQRILEGQVI